MIPVEPSPPLSRRLFRTGSWRPWWLAMIVTISVAAVFLVGSFHPSWWSGWRPAPCAATRCFCEAPHLDTLVQPINAYSSLAYVFVGLVILLTMSTGPVAKRWFGWSLITLGVGSAFYHGTLSFVGQVWDVLGLYAVGLVIVAWTLEQTWQVRWRWIALMVFGLAVAAVLMFFIWPDIRRPFFGVLVGLVLLSALAGHVRSRRVALWPVVAGALILGLATLIWSFDEQHSICRTHPWFQGHAIWHVLGAVATWLYSRTIHTLSGR